MSRTGSGGLRQSGRLFALEELDISELTVVRVSSVKLTAADLLQSESIGSELSIHGILYARLSLVPVRQPQAVVILSQ